VRGDRAKLELAENSPKPTEDLKVYPRSPKSYFDYTSLWDDVMNAKLWNTRGLNLSEVETKYTVAFDALGPLGADHYLFSYLERRVNEIQNTHVGIALNLMAVANGSAQPPSAPAKGLQEVQRLLEVYRPIFGVAIPTINISWLSPKVLTLAELLLSVQSESFQGIVFVEQRHVTTALSWLLSGISALNEWLKCAPFVGHGTNSSSNIEALGSRGMTFKLQNDVVKSFRDSEFNLLIATSVAEEGLDFQVCLTQILLSSPTHFHILSGLSYDRSVRRLKNHGWVRAVERASTSS
jgi:endoribonuclease Dicer